MSRVIVAAASFLSLALATNVALGDFLCPTVALGTQVEPGTGKIRYLYGGKKCPGSFQGSGFDYRAHTLGGNCTSCVDAIQLRSAVGSVTFPKEFDPDRDLALRPPRVNDPGTSPPGRPPLIATAEGIIIVKDFELILERKGKSHLFRILALQEKAGGEIHWMGYEVAIDDPGRDSTREPVIGKLEAPDSAGFAHIVLYKELKITVESATVWK